MIKVFISTQLVNVPNHGWCSLERESLNVYLHDGEWIENKLIQDQGKEGLH